jgi:hypothetical protein
MTKYLQNDQATLINELVLDRTITRSEFAMRFPVQVEELGGLGLKILEESILTRDAYDVMGGIRLAFSIGLCERYEDILIALAEEPWHLSHEDVAMALDRLRPKSPRAADAFQTLATSSHSYLAYDENYALGVKCIWGLGNMRTVEAVNALGHLLTINNPVFTENVLEQLERIEDQGANDVLVEAIRRARLKKK